MHFNAYLDSLSNTSEEIAESINKSITDLWRTHLLSFNFNEHFNGLLFGQVQSGKTSQMLGLVAKAADEGFKLIIILTTDNVSLQRQTLERALSSLDTFNICDETDDLRFRTGGQRKPVLLVLKKNGSVLNTWRSHLASVPYVKTEPLFIVDDEGDAASLNTLVNKNDQSRINSLIGSIRKNSPSSIFISVTATPQALVLQVQDSQMRPAFAHCIDPGINYLGGDYFYSENSRCLRPTDENERKVLFSGPSVPEGLRKAVINFLIVSANRSLEGLQVTNFLIHPSVRIVDHARVENKVNQYLSDIKTDLKRSSNSLLHSLMDEWQNLNTTKQSMLDFDKIVSHLPFILKKVKVMVINSASQIDYSYNQGINIVIGGNTLGRGLTFEGLNTVYYCRIAKTPQADTCWQHSRIFGYDRDKELCRIFLPPSLLHLFRALNEANDAMIDVLKEKGPDAVSILSLPNTRPTRKSVVKAQNQFIIIGGVNYFPFNPISSNLTRLDDACGMENTEKIITLKEALKLLDLTAVDNDDSFPKDIMIKAIDALARSTYKRECRLIIRTGRDVGKGTGTLLSPDDRQLCNSFKDQFVLVLYRLNGTKDKGWQGKPLWVPNIKYPEGKNYYSIT